MLSESAVAPKYHWYVRPVPEAFTENLPENLNRSFAIMVDRYIFTGSFTVTSVEPVRSAGTELQFTSAKRSDAVCCSYNRIHNYAESSVTRSGGSCTIAGV